MTWARGRGGQRAAHRRSLIDDDAPPSTARAVGEKKIAAALVRPPVDEFGEAIRRQRIGSPTSSEPSRAGPVIRHEFLNVGELAGRIVELVDSDRDPHTDPRPTCAKLLPGRLLDPDSQQMHVKQPSATLPDDLGATDQDGALAAGAVQSLAQTVVMALDVGLVKSAGTERGQENRRDLIGS